jgi:hypothetical protein
MIGVQVVAVSGVALTSDATPAELADLARRCFEKQGYPSFQRAEAALRRKQRPGRPALAVDVEAIAEMEWLVERGHASSPARAAGMIADRYPGNSRDATVERLRRKYRANHREKIQNI